MATSLACSTLLTASSCVALSQGKRVGAKVKVEVFCVPWKMSRSSASRLFFA